MNKLLLVLFISTSVTCLTRQESPGIYESKLKQQDSYPSISQSHWSRLRASMRRNTILLQGQAMKLRFNLNKLFVNSGNATTASVAFDLYMQEIMMVLDDFRNKLDQTPTTIVSSESEDEDTSDDEMDAESVFTFFPNSQEQIQLTTNQAQGGTSSPTSTSATNGLPLVRPNSPMSPSKPTPGSYSPSIYQPNVPFMPSMPILQGFASLGGNNGLGLGLSLNPKSLGQMIHNLIG